MKKLNRRQIVALSVLFVIAVAAFLLPTDEDYIKQATSGKILDRAKEDVLPLIEAGSFVSLEIQDPVLEEHLFPKIKKFGEDKDFLVVGSDEGVALKKGYSLNIVTAPGRPDGYLNLTFLLREMDPSKLLNYREYQEKLFSPWSVLPPLIAIALVVLMAWVLRSLLIGVLSGAVLSACYLGGSVEAFGQTTTYLWGQTIGDSFHLWTLLFIVTLMAMARVMIYSGGMKGVAALLAHRANSSRSTQLATALMGVAIFFDDYANTVIVGASARPLTDRQRISREKLAFLVDATAAPISGIAFISTWVGYEIGLFHTELSQVGAGVSGYEMFFMALPFRFYCILMLAFVFILVFLKRDFGPMLKAETRARLKGELYAPDAMIAKDEDDTGNIAPSHWMNAFMPIVVVFVASMILLFLDGGGVAGVSEKGFTLQVLIDCFAGADNIRMLTYASCMGLGTAVLLPMLQRHSSFTTGKAIVAVCKGVKSSWLAICILTLAWALGAMCKDLGTAHFLAAIVKDVVTPGILPITIFLTAGAVAFATGTSWGTMAILLPVTIPLAYTTGDIWLTTISIGAVLDGAIFGDHCSPISDTTIMSSTSAGCDHIHHVNTQLPYAFIVMGTALVCGYLLAPLGVPPLVSIGLGIVAMFLIIRFVGKPVPDRVAKKV